jgi:YidC/Oxa1 family membrane protein insertase
LLNFLYTLFGPILHWFYELTASYGWAIILFSIFAKIITVPFSVTQAKSTKIMKMMAPYQERITKKYGSNNEKSNTELMRLYKNFNYKPWAGCLPILIQWPLLIGLFGVLRDPEKYVFTPEEYALVSKSFLWIGDLNKAPSALFAEGGMLSGAFLISLIVPVVSTALMIVSQRMMTPKTGQQQNNTFIMMMNVFMLFIFYTASQGLAIYWTMNSVLSIAQSLILERLIHVELPETIKQKQAERGKKTNR